MTDGARAFQTANDFFAVEIPGDMAQSAVGVKFIAVKTRHAGRLLAAVLERMQAERDHRRCAFDFANAEDTAFLAQFVVVVGIGGQHVHVESA